MAGIPTDAGQYAHIVAKRAPFERLSRAAKHRAFPKLFMAPDVLAPPAPRAIPPVPRDVPLVGPRLPVPPREASLRIITVVARHWEVDPRAIAAEGRHKGFVLPRQACYLLMRSLLGCSLNRIGKTLGNRDHTTVMDGLRFALRRMDHDVVWRAKYDAALAELKGGAS